MLTVRIADAQENWSAEKPVLADAALFREVTQAAGINYKHRELEYIDFNIQNTLPHKFSDYCPALASGDLDGNGLDDIIIGGNSYVRAKLLLQQKNGKFLQRELLNDTVNSAMPFKDAGILIFDANGDGKQDVYLSSGGFQYKSNSSSYQDRLYLNDGKGNFALAENALPVNYTSKLCVRAMDFNRDGKLDIFVSGRVDPGNYPKPVSSFLFRNDSEKGIVRFTDVTDEIAPDLKNIGMVCDALFSDFDSDNQPDLVLAGEWMPVVFLKNIQGKFKNITAETGISKEKGWWNSIIAGDFRHTGRIDYIVGNAGVNTLYKASDKYPVSVIGKDFANNGGYEVFPSLFLRDQKGELKEFPANGRDEVIEKLPGLKKRFNSYKSFATVTMADIFPDSTRKGAVQLQATQLQSCFVRNDGNGKFTLVPLPAAAQISTLNGMIADDFDADGNLDVLISGNDYGTEVTIGRYDALNGLLLKGDGSGGFMPLSILQSGIYIPGNAKGLVKLSGNRDNYFVAASQNREVLKLFELKRKVKIIKVNPSDAYALIRYKDGKTEKREFYFGSSFLSQSARFLEMNASVAAIDIFDINGRQRAIKN